MRRILLVEDEQRIAGFVTKGLQKNGFEVVATNSGTSAVAFATHGEFDLIILDIGLPDISGFDVLERIRGQGVKTPVIMLTARTSAADAVAGLTSGADDYMTKPFSFEELLARVELRIKAGQPLPLEMAREHQGLSLNHQTNAASVDGVEVTLSSREFKLLGYFMDHPGQVLSRDQLLQHVWGHGSDTYNSGSNVVDVYVRYLRNKIGAHRIETVRGMGYRLS